MYRGRVACDDLRSTSTLARITTQEDAERAQEQDKGNEPGETRVWNMPASLLGVVFSERGRV